MKKVAVVVGFLLVLCSMGFSEPERGKPGKFRKGRFGMHKKFMRQDFEKIEKKVLEFLREHFPEKKAKLDKAKENNPRRYRKAIWKFSKKYLRLAKLKEKNPEQFKKIIKLEKLKYKTQKLGWEYRKSEDAAQRNGIKKELSKYLDEIFDLKHENQLKRIKKLEEKLNKLREKAEKRKKNKSAIIEKRIEKLTGEGDDLDWNPGKKRFKKRFRRGWNR